MIIFMGIASPLFTRRMQVSTDNLLHLMDRPQNASRPPMPQPAGKRAAFVPPSPMPEGARLAAIAERQVRP
jgi:hypothetical protein